MSSSGNSRLKYGISIVGWLLLFLAMTELFARAFLVSNVPPSALKQGGKFEVWGLEGYGITRYLPYAEAKTPYASGDYSIVILGSSFTLANQVMDWQSYASVAETRLNTDGLRVDIHNLGINGLSLPSYIARSSFVLEQYQPDIIVVQVSPGDFLTTGFKPDLLGGHFDYAPDNSIVLAPPPSDSYKFQLPEQLDGTPPPTNFLNVFSLSVYLAHLERANAPGADAEYESQRGRLDDADIIKQELQLLAEAYPDKPIVFVFIPGDVNIRRREAFYKDSERYQQIFQIIRSDHPSWTILYPLEEFNQLLQTGYAPRGFNNTEPFLGHMNAHGHRIVGELLAGLLESLLK